MSISSFLFMFQPERISRQKQRFFSFDWWQFDLSVRVFLTDIVGLCVYFFT